MECYLKLASGIVTVLLALLIFVFTIRDLLWEDYYSAYTQRVEAIENRLRAGNQDLKKEIRIDYSVDGETVTITTQIVPLAQTAQIRGYELGAYQLDKQPKLKRILARVVGSLQEVAPSASPPCTVNLTIEGHADGIPIKPEATYEGEFDWVFKYPYEDEDGWELQMDLRKGDKLENLDIAFLRAYGALNYIQKTPFMRNVRESTLVVKATCKRGGCFRKIVLTAEFEELLRPEYQKLATTTRILVRLKIL